MMSWPHLSLAHREPCTPTGELIPCWSWDSDPYDPCLGKLVQPLIAELAPALGKASP